jgi:ATP-dependent phosphoenolpyruvate carboxykinase
MESQSGRPYGLEKHGIKNTGFVYWNLSTPLLYNDDSLDGSLSKAPMSIEPLFGLAVPSECPGVPAEILTPRNTCKDKAAYDAQAQKLAGMFAENFKTFADQVSPEVRQAGPQPA